METNEILSIRHLSKSFGPHQVLRDIDFTVRKGDVTSILGASGSGKSTLLRCINLLETPDSGAILYHGEDILSGKVFIEDGKQIASRHGGHLGLKIIPDISTLRAVGDEMRLF